VFGVLGKQGANAPEPVLPSEKFSGLLNRLARRGHRRISLSVLTDYLPVRLGGPCYHGA
jgi:hypothetical protein